MLEFEEDGRWGRNICFITGMDWSYDLFYIVGSGVTMTIDSL
jgi:hypothetical protein